MYVGGVSAFGKIVISRKYPYNFLYPKIADVKILVLHITSLFPSDARRFRKGRSHGNQPKVDNFKSLSSEKMQLSKLMVYSVHKSEFFDPPFNHDGLVGKVEFCK